MMPLSPHTQVQTYLKGHQQYVLSKGAKKTQKQNKLTFKVGGETIPLSNHLTVKLKAWYYARTTFNVTFIINFKLTTQPYPFDWPLALFS